jgi:AcrR family transcriptional regulator
MARCANRDNSERSVRYEVNLVMQRPVPVDDGLITRPARLLDATSARRRELAAGIIEQAAIDLFCDQPLEAVTVAQIADAAQVSVRSFYRYFSSKEQILLAAPERRADQISKATLARPRTERPFQAMRAAIDELSGPDDLELRRWQQAVVTGRAGDRMSQQVVAVTSPILTRTLAARLGEVAGVDFWSDIAGVTIATALVVGARRWSRDGGSLREHILPAVDAVGRGLLHGPS